MRVTAFFKKELREIVKTPKVIILPAILLFFGMTSPLLARYTAELLKSMGGPEFANFPMPEAKFTDAYAQFFKNLTQIGVIVVALIFAGVVVEEKVKGSAILVLTKSVSRTQFILSKLAAVLLLFTGAFVLASVACIYYTFLLFPKFYTDYLILGFAMLWLFTILLITITVFISTISKSFMMSAVLSFLAAILLSATSAIPRVKEYTPGSLASFGLDLINGAKTFSDVIAVLVISVLAILAFALGSIAVFNRQEI